MPFDEPQLASLFLVIANAKFKARPMPHHATTSTHAACLAAPRSTADTLRPHPLILPQIPAHFSEPLRDLISRILTPNPKMRATMEQVRAPAHRRMYPPTSCMLTWHLTTAFTASDSGA